MSLPLHTDINVQELLLLLFYFIGCGARNVFAFLLPEGIKVAQSSWVVRKHTNRRDLSAQLCVVINEIYFFRTENLEKN